MQPIILIGLSCDCLLFEFRSHVVAWSFLEDDWWCDCPHFHFTKGEICKHIREVQGIL